MIGRRVGKGKKKGRNRGRRKKWSEGGVGEMECRKESGE